LPKVKQLLDDFISSQLVSFEKIPILIPFENTKKSEGKKKRKRGK